jgi:hypothetical protein
MWTRIHEVLLSLLSLILTGHLSIKKEIAKGSLHAGSLAS